MSLSGPGGEGARLRTFAAYADSSDVATKVVSQFQESYKISDQLILIRSNLLTTDVARKVGLFEGDDPPSGVVLKLNDSSAGYYDADLWDWLD